MASGERVAGSRDVESAGGSFWSFRRARKKAARARAEAAQAPPGCPPPRPRAAPGPPPGLALDGESPPAAYGLTAHASLPESFVERPFADREQMGRLERKVDQILEALNLLAPSSLEWPRPARAAAVGTGEGLAGDFRSLPASGWETMHGPFRPKNREAAGAATSETGAPRLHGEEWPSALTRTTASRALVVTGNMELTVFDAPFFAESADVAASLTQSFRLLLPEIGASTVSVDLHESGNASVSLVYAVAAGSAETASTATKAIATWRVHDLLCFLNEGLASAAGQVIMAIRATKPSGAITRRDSGFSAVAGRTPTKAVAEHISLAEEATWPARRTNIECLERAIRVLSQTEENEWTNLCYFEALRAGRARRERRHGQPEH